MFSEWTDPYDIDHYYNDLNELTRNIVAAPSSNMYQQMPLPSPVKKELPVESPVGEIVNAPNPDNSKNAFEVKPNSIFLDQHPVGAQPRYNILQSGPPDKESFWNKKEFCAIDLMNIVMYVTIIVMVFLLIKTRCEVSYLSKTVSFLLHRR